jgi:hypothetical protein
MWLKFVPNIERGNRGNSGGERMKRNLIFSKSLVENLIGAAVALTVLLTFVSQASSALSEPGQPSTQKRTNSSRHSSFQTLPSLNNISNPLQTLVLPTANILTAEYHEAASIDRDILPGVKTELWARAYWPDLATAPAKIPIIILLHGNHGTCGVGQSPRVDSTCDYTATGTCPAGYIVTPNHEGYKLAATELASNGYFVVSINANRGITCGDSVQDDYGLILARGRLILRHLEELEKINSGLRPTFTSMGLDPSYFKGRLNFGEVGIMGHSRGGEGARAAFDIFQKPGSPWRSRIHGLKIKAIFEVGAVDGQSSVELNALGTAWHQLLPMCDGDVSDLEGRNPFERMLKMNFEPETTPKSLWMVWGANHNYFNSEWQESDSPGCKDSLPNLFSTGFQSQEQQRILATGLLHFFNAHVSSQSSQFSTSSFDPLLPLPTELSRLTKIEREFIPSVLAAISQPLVNLAGSSNPVTTSFSEVVIRQNASDTPENISISWNSKPRPIEPPPLNFYRHANSFVSQATIPTAPAPATTTVPTSPAKHPVVNISINSRGLGKDLSRFGVLDLRVQAAKLRSSSEGALDFNIGLVDTKGVLSARVLASQGSDLMGPANYVETYQTLRIPLKLFSGVDLNSIQGLQLIFDRQDHGDLLLAGVRASQEHAPRRTLVRSPNLNTNASNTERPSSLKVASANRNPENSQNEDAQLRNNILVRPARIVHATHITASPQLVGSGGYEFVVESDFDFPISNALPVLQIGDVKIRLSRRTKSDKSNSLTFVVTSAEKTKLMEPSIIKLTIGKSTWSFDQKYTESLFN